MAVYVMSDIHGMYHMFQGMIQNIRLKVTDQLYILGDVIDHGPDSIKLVQLIMSMNNVHMLLGEHEYRMLTFYTGSSIASRFGSLNDWIENGGSDTLDAMGELQASEANAIVDYLKKLRYAEQVRVKGRVFCLIHGWPSTSVQKSLTYHPALSEDPHLLKGQTLIIGHTPTAQWHYDRSPDGFRRYINTMEAKGQHMRVEHAPHFIGMDCGAYWTQWTTTGALACLRLDDMREFYITRKDGTKE